MEKMGEKISPTVLDCTSVRDIQLGGRKFSIPHKIQFGRIKKKNSKFSVDIDEARRGDNGFRMLLFTLRRKGGPCTVYSVWEI